VRRQSLVSKARPAGDDGRGLRDGGVGAALDLQEVERYADARRQLMLATARVFAAATARPVAELKQQETLEAIRAIGNIPGFLFAQVRTPDGRVLAALGGASRLLTDPLLNQDETPSILDLLSGGTILISVPVIDGGKEVGRINLISDTADLWPRLLSTLWLTLLGSLAAIAVGLLIAWRSSARSPARCVGWWARCRRCKRIIATTCMSPERRIRRSAFWSMASIRCSTRSATAISI